MRLIGTEPEPGQGASHALTRALDLLDLLRNGPRDLKSLQQELGLSRSTIHRLASPLIARRFIVAEQRSLRLGSGLIRLGFMAGRRSDLIGLAWPILSALSASTQDATHLAVRSGDEIVYIAQAPGRRRVCVRHPVGARNSLRATALGRALMADAAAPVWRALYPEEPCPLGGAHDIFHHLEPDGDQVRCIAAPVRDVSGEIIAAVSLSSLPLYMDSNRMDALAPQVQAAARALSVELGFFEN